MPVRVRPSELAYMTEEERRKALDDLVRAAKYDGADTRAALRARIREYEIRYEMTSDEMRRRFALGEVPDTAEISRWLLLLEALHPHGPRETRPE